jgi:hypothetical protein
MQSLAPMIGKNLQQATTNIITQQMIADNKCQHPTIKTKKGQLFKSPNYGFHMENNIK